MNEYRDCILRLLCFSAGTVPPGTIDNPETVIFLHQLGSHPPFYLPRTWAQYGQNHEGVCLVFSRKKLTTKFQKLAAGKYELRIEDIKYTDFVKKDHLVDIGDLLSISKEDMLKYRDKGIVHKILTESYRKLYMVKDNDWKDERECRALLWESGPCEPNKEVLFDIDGLLVAMFVGLRFDQKQMAFYEEQARARNIPLYSLKMDEFMIVADQVI
jgi:hypothetical protein